MSLKVVLEVGKLLSTNAVIWHFLPLEQAAGAGVDAKNRDTIEGVVIREHAALVGDRRGT